MSIHILQLVKEDLETQGLRLEDYKLIQLKSLLEYYNKKYNR